VALAPDGHTLAYSLATVGDTGQESGPLMMADLDAAAAPASYPGTAALLPRALSWSPDGTRLAFRGQDGADPYDIAIYLATLPPNRTPNIVPRSETSWGVQSLVGWQDDEHLVVMTVQGSLYGLATLDVQTGASRVIAALPNYPVQVALAPDGQAALITTAGSSSTAEHVNLVTGHMQPLPTIGQRLNGQYAWYAWAPGTQRVAITVTPLGVEIPTAWSAAMLDLDHDTAVPFDPFTEPLAWSPDGSTLVVETRIGGTALHAFTFGPNGVQLAETSLASNVAGFVGFVRTV
jgi:hypothetical protein